MNIPCGKICDEPNSVYHKRDAVSSSKLKLFIKSAERYHRTHVVHDVLAPTSDALDFGIAAHALLESEDAFRLACAVNPYSNFRSDGAKAWRASMEAQGKVVLSPAEEAALRKMRSNAHAHPTLGRLIASAPETEVTWRAKFGRFYVQARTDRYSAIGCELTDGKPYFIDYKTTPTLLDNAFEREASKYDYHFQMGYYREVVKAVVGGEEPPRAFIGALESEPPYDVAVYEFDADAMLVAKAEVMNALRDLKQCYETDEWPGLPVGIQPLSLTGWKAKTSHERVLASNQKRELTA